MKKFNEFVTESKFVEGELGGIPKDIAHKIFSDDKHKIYVDLVKALNLDEGVNTLILTKIHNELGRNLNKEEIEPRGFSIPIPKEYFDGLTEEEKDKIVTFIEKIFEINKEYFSKMKSLVNELI